MSNKILTPLLIAAVGIVVVAALVVARPKPAPSPAEASVSNVKVAVVPVKRQALRLSVAAQGTVHPKREIELVTQVSGQVVAVEAGFVDGGFFDASERLVQIDDRDYKAAVLVANAQLAQARQRLAEEEGLSRQAKREWRDLGNQNANDLFMRKPQLAAATANLASAEGGLSIAELNLERTRITVPFDGRVKEIHVDLGQFVVKGTSLATVYDSTMVEVRLPLTEKQAALVDLPFVQANDQESLDALPKVILIGSIAGTEYQWQGVLARTDAFVDAHSRMYYAVVEVSNPFLSDNRSSGHKAPLLPGLFVEAEIEGKYLDNVIELPRSALYERDKLVILGDDNKTSLHTVKVLRRTEDRVWVQAPIPSETLVVTEKQSLTPIGTLVEPLMTDSAESTVAMESLSTFSEPTEAP